MIESLDIGAVHFSVTSGATPIAGARVYVQSPGMPIYQWSYKGNTSQYGILDVWNLPAGVNSYMISATGYTTVRGTVNVIGGRSTTLNVNMIRSLSTLAVGSLNIVSNPPDACVCIDDAPQYVTTPITIAEIPVGDHMLILSKDGYVDYTTPVTIVSDQTTTISANLTPYVI